MTGSPSRRVHIVDDDELVRARISYLLTNRGYSTEIYTGGPELFHDDHVKRGCILLDLCMPDMSGHEVQEELTRLDNILPVEVMSAFRDIPGVVRAIKLGAADFIEKPATEEDLCEAIDRAQASFEEGAPRRNVAVAASARFKRLSRRQQQILQEMLNGYPNKAIAYRLGVSPRTVEMHRAKLMRALGFTGVSEVVQFAIDAGLTCDAGVRAPNAGRQRSDSLASAGA